MELEEETERMKADIEAQKHVIEDSEKQIQVQKEEAAKEAKPQ
jgi:hypothetical protein